VIEAYFDGCCEPVNPGGTASYGAIVLVNGVKIWEDAELVSAPPGGKTSNNVAEYSGFIAVVRFLLLGYPSECERNEPAIIRGDSKLVIMQVQGLWRVNGGHYLPFYREAKKLWKRLKKQQPNITLEWIPRERNGLADELSKCLVKKAGVTFRLQPE